MSQPYSPNIFDRNQDFQNEKLWLKLSQPNEFHFDNQNSNAMYQSRFLKSQGKQANNQIKIQDSAQQQIVKNQDKSKINQIGTEQIEQSKYQFISQISITSQLRQDLKKKQKQVSVVKQENEQEQQIEKNQKNQKNQKFKKSQYKIQESNSKQKKKSFYQINQIKKQSSDNKRKKKKLSDKQGKRCECLLM